MIPPVHWIARALMVCRAEPAGSFRESGAGADPIALEVGGRCLWRSVWVTDALTDDGKAV